jgi:hypothetical protein
MMISVSAFGASDERLGNAMDEIKVQPIQSIIRKRNLKRNASSAEVGFSGA